jgi:hypothetical protein
MISVLLLILLGELYQGKSLSQNLLHPCKMWFNVERHHSQKLLKTMESIIILPKNYSLTNKFLFVSHGKAMFFHIDYLHNFH